MRVRINAADCPDRPDCAHRLPKIKGLSVRANFPARQEPRRGSRVLALSTPAPSSVRPVRVIYIVPGTGKGNANNFNHRRR